MPIAPDTLGARLAARRKALALSQSAAGARCLPPIDVVRWSRYENNRTSPDPGTLERIAAALDVEARALMPPR